MQAASAQGGIDLTAYLPEKDLKSMACKAEILLEGADADAAASVEVLVPRKQVQSLCSRPCSVSSLRPATLLALLTLLYLRVTAVHRCSTEPPRCSPSLNP